MTTARFIYRSRLWTAIWAYILLTYLTLPLMRPVLRWLRHNLGAEGLGTAFNIALALAALALLVWALRHGWRTLLGLLVPIALIGLVALQLPQPEERAHFLQYGLLGLMVVATRRQPGLLPLALAALFVVAVGTGDEFIQWLLPNRVGDWRDVGFNALAGVMGVAMGASLTAPREPAEVQASPPNSTIS